MAGAAVIGAGYFAYHEHEKNEEKVALFSLRICKRIYSHTWLFVFVPGRRRHTPGVSKTGSKKPKTVQMLFINTDLVPPPLGSWSKAKTSLRVLSLAVKNTVNPFTFLVHSTR